MTRFLNRRIPWQVRISKALHNTTIDEFFGPRLNSDGRERTLIINGKIQKPSYLIHGGAGPTDPSRPWVNKATKILESLGAKLAITPFQTGTDFVTNALCLMEDHPEFNAGLGSALQEDGIPRLTASLMDGTRRSFSGVISIKSTQNPSKLSLSLQNHSSRVLTGPGHDRLARDLGLPTANLRTEKRLEAWLKKVKEDMPLNDTVGCVYWDGNGGLFAGSSTGGRGFETPGRVSDSCTVAGNYASSFLAVTATGIGEEIVDDAVAARLETRVRDGMPLAEAGQKMYEEAQQASRAYGWIAIDQKGNWQVAYTSDAMTYVGQTLGEEGFFTDSSS